MTQLKLEIQPSQKKASWVEWPFKWIDRYESQSTRTIIQGVITTIIGAAILATLALIWNQRGLITQGSKSIWNLLRYPVQLQLWIFVLTVIAVVWILFLIRRNSTKNPPQSEKVLKQLAELDKQFSELKTQDARFIEIVNYIIDEGRAKGLRTIVERCIGSVDKAVPFVQQSETFDEFLGNAGVQLDVVNTVKTPFEYPQMNGHMQFGIPIPDNPTQFEFANITTERGGVVHMNEAAHMHFDLSFYTFKRQFDSKFNSKKGDPILQRSSKAANAIYQKYIRVLNSYRNCAPLIGINDTDERLKERKQIFEKEYAELVWEVQSQELLIERKDKLRNLNRMMWLIFHYVKAEERLNLKAGLWHNLWVILG